MSGDFIPPWMLYAILVIALLLLVVDVAAWVLKILATKWVLGF